MHRFWKINVTRLFHLTAACLVASTVPETGAEAQKNTSCLDNRIKVCTTIPADPKFAAEATRVSDLINEEEIPGLRIGWRLHNPFDAYMRAIEAKIPLVILFHAPDCKFCDRLVETFRCPAINRFAGRAVFSLTMPAIDEQGRQLRVAADLERTGYPSMVVLRPDPDRVTIVDKVVGELEAGRLEAFLEGAITTSYQFVNEPEPESLKHMHTLEELHIAYKARGLDWVDSGACARKAESK